MNTAYMICYSAIGLAILLLVIVLVSRSNGQKKPHRRRSATFISYDMKQKSYYINHGISHDDDGPVFVVSRKIGDRKE